MTRWAGMSCLTHVWHCMTLGCYRHRMTLEWYFNIRISNNLSSMTCQQHASCLWVPVLRLAGFMRCHLLKKKHTTSNSHEQPTLVTAETHLYDTHAWAMYRLFASHRLCDWGYTTDLGASHPPCLCDLQYLSCVDTQTLTWHCWQLA